MSCLNEQEIEKYQRHLLIDGFTPALQEKIRSSRVLVIGGGGLGSPVLLYLAGAGVGTLGVVEFDQVELSNLHRQILYSTEDIGKQKIERIQHKISILNPDCTIHTFPEAWTAENAYTLSGNYDILVDCTDNYPSRYLSDRVSQKLSIPLVYGAVYQLEGQVAVFNFKGSKTFSQLFPEPDHEIQHQNGGVLGPIAGVIGSMQAAEVLKIITGIGEVMANKMLTLSLKYNRFKIVEY